MPNLENLKKQAKLYLRWHRDHYYPVAARISAVLPSFRHLSDGEVLARSFKLSDAQELIARKAGFESWEALRKGVQSMTDTQSETLSKPTLLAAEPQLFVADIAVSCAFYTRQLGFSVAFTYGEPPFYAQVVRDGARGKYTPQQLNDLLMRLLGGSKWPEAPKPVHVNDLLRKIEKEIPGVMASYDSLSEIVHPNWSGVVGLYSKADQKNFITYFGRGLHAADRTREQISNAMLGSLGVFEYAYNRISDLMPSFLAELESIWPEVEAQKS